jgi:pimeloyl-ACP methyl ester carboxylesterase
LAIALSSLEIRSDNSNVSNDFTYPSSNLIRSTASDGVTAPLATAAINAPVAFSASAAVVIAGKEKPMGRSLLLHARGDAQVPFEQGRKLAAGIPGAKFVALQSSNHILLEQEPALQRSFEETSDAT